LSHSYASTTPSARDHESVDESRRDGLKVMLGFGSGSGTRGHGASSKASRDEGWNASVSSSASVSEYDEDDEGERAERKRMDKGKAIAREVEDTGKTQVKDTDREDAYEWIIMDFCDDNGTCIALSFTGHSHFFYPSTRNNHISRCIRRPPDNFYVLISLLTTFYIQRSRQFFAFSTVILHARSRLPFFPSRRP
jgi:hypothetical protein